MKACIFLVVILCSLSGYSQTSINTYKYVLMPEKFDFSKADDQYGLNTTSRRLLEKKGFIVLGGNDALPPAVAANRCNALKAEVTQRRAFLSTNLTLLLKDCQGNIVFKSKEGKSREKEFDVAYNEALRNAFVSLDTLSYHYDSTLLAQSQQPAFAQTQPASTQTQPASAQTQSAPAQTQPVRPAPADFTGVLYAQPAPNGYQLVDTTPKKVLTLLKTSLQDSFIAEAGGVNGIVYKRDNEWVFEYYDNSKLVTQKLQIKF